MTLTRKLFYSAIVATLATSASYLIAFFAGWLDGPINWLEFAAVFTSYACTYLCVVQTRWNYPVGVVTTTLYSILFWQFGLIASSVLNACFALYLAYGWFRWRPDTITRPVSNVSLRAFIGHLVITGIAYFAFVETAFLVAAETGTEFPFLWNDSLILVLSLLAQLLLDNKRIETWFVWVLVNLIAIYTYFNQELFIVTLQYVFFLANTIYGWYSWRKSMTTTEDKEVFA